MNHVALVLSFVVGACTATALQSAAGPEPSAPPSAASAAVGREDQVTPVPRSQPSVLPLREAERRQSPPGTATVTFLARGRNAFLARLEMKPEAQVPSHRDLSEEFIHVLSGQGTMTIDGQKFPVEPGTTIYMPANAEVSFVNGDQPMAAIQVFAGPESAAKYDGWRTTED